MFGRSADVSWRLPAAGEEVDRQLAMAQHAAALHLYLRKDPTAARRVGERFGFSIKTWSDYTLGKSWMSRRALAGAISLLLEQE